MLLLLRNANYFIAFRVEWLIECILSASDM